MSARLKSWSPRDNSERVLLAAALGIAIFISSWAALHQGWFARNQIIDTPVYEKYGNLMAQGEVPYRDFAVEYPPGALPVFVLPALGHVGDSGRFRRSFETLMAVCGSLLMIGVALSLGALGASPRRLWGGVVLAGVSPLLVGSVILTRFDLYPAAIAVCALAALLRGRLRVGHALLGLAIVTKIWPGVLLPITVAHVWRTRGRREALACLATAVATMAVILLPFVALSPSGVWNSVVRQTTRPLQVESLGAALLVASHHVFGTSAAMVSSHGSQNLGGTAANVVGVLQTLSQVGVLLALWIWFARRTRSREELVQACAAAVVAFIALGKVVSPQFLIWLIPFVPLVRKRLAAALFVVALVLTQAWFPQRYWGYALSFDGETTAIVLARDLVLLALLGVLLTPDRRTWDGEPTARDNPIAVSVIVRRGCDVLILHRAHEGADFAGDWAWGPPAGARHPGEDVLACARRELLEETGLELTVEPFAAPDEYIALYTAEAPAGVEITLSSEHDAYRWVSLDEAIALCKPERVANQLRATCV
jgi:8-oxo-dGTP pyrophosphatase MutT (NUDIX family)